MLNNIEFDSICSPNQTNKGLKKASRVAILGLNSDEYIIALYGCAKAG